MQTTPASLLERLRGPGDPEAWDRFVSLYTPLIFSWGRRAGLQDEDAADLVQEVFVILVQTLPKFAYDQHQSFRAWLRTVTLNKWRDGRKRSGRQIQAADAAPLAGLATTNDVETFWETEYRQHLARNALRVMQADFQPTTWKAFWEHVVAERTAPDVAAKLGISIGAVYAAKIRVLDRLREELSGMLE